MFDQIFLQRPQCVMQARLHRPHRAVEHTGDFFVRQSLSIAQDDRFSLRIRKQGDGGP